MTAATMRTNLFERFVPVIRSLTDADLDNGAVLGDKLRIAGEGAVEVCYEHLCELGVIQRERVLEGLPHPSGSNAERIAYFLGRKNRGALSSKTNPEKLDRAREVLRRQVARLIEGTRQRGSLS